VVVTAFWQPKIRWLRVVLRTNTKGVRRSPVSGKRTVVWRREIEASRRRQDSEFGLLSKGGAHRHQPPLQIILTPDLEAVPTGFA